jgi:hypothetical protein
MTIHCGRHRPYNFVIHGVTPEDFSNVHMSTIHSDLELVAAEIVETAWDGSQEQNEFVEVTVRNPRNYQEQTFIVRAEPNVVFRAYVKPDQRVET